MFNFYSMPDLSPVLKTNKQTKKVSSVWCYRTCSRVQERGVHHKLTLRKVTSQTEANDLQKERKWGEETEGGGIEK